MCRVLAIIAAVMSVMTGGQLRCPCQFVSLRSDLPNTAELSPASRDSCTVSFPSRDRCRGCGAHRDADCPSPVKKRPIHHEPCGHSLGVDLAPFAAADRLSNLEGSEVGSVATTSCALLPLLIRVPPSFEVKPFGPDSAPLTRLRYAHSFRC